MTLIPIGPSGNETLHIESILWGNGLYISNPAPIHKLGYVARGFTALKVQKDRVWRPERSESATKYKLGYVKRGSTAFKVPKDGCGVPSAVRALLGPEGL